MPDQTPMPRTARVRAVDKPGVNGVKTVYEMRGVSPEENVLLSEYETEEEALDAVKRYENGD